MRLLSAKIMSHCHSVITLLGTISYSILFLRPCESCSNTISALIQDASAPAGSYGGSDELRLLERSLAQSRDQPPPYCGGGPIYVSGPRCGPACLSCCGESEDYSPPPPPTPPHPSSLSTCLQSLIRWWRIHRSGFRERIIQKMQLQERCRRPASCSRTLPTRSIRGPSR